LDSVVLEKTYLVPEPLPTPSLPAEPFTLPGAHHVPPYFLFYPSL
jgi:hypothetical protein